ncbi:hypothetical protein AWQ24_13945 [Picosynechococcus sp. PCC 8807]|uniref:iron uptake porin n=2 Tax=Picosynechococcus sp. PCC 8807 TaxID=195248 RepID=UPI0008106F42|nr:iron uptake porin [Picosynechococcus sp. PCC 8807]ANV91639.1 hypothetical protein AWQ24_13945 [Picosynechococcus sp. PCC 8807]
MKTSIALWRALPIAAATAGMSLASPSTVQANTALLDQINHYTQDDLAQVNSVFQLSDVSPSDWAFDALRNLVENYNCIVGYPDGTFRGSRPLSRYEFAAGLNACLQQIERMIQSGGSEVTPEDLAALRRLINEFEAELATLGAHVDDLEGRVEFLEDHQFSTTTKLKGEVIFAVTDAFGDTNPLDDSLTFYTERVGDEGGEGEDGGENGDAESQQGGNPDSIPLRLGELVLPVDANPPTNPRWGAIIGEGQLARAVRSRINLLLIEESELIRDFDETGNPFFKGIDAYQGTGGVIAFLNDVENLLTDPRVNDVARNVGGPDPLTEEELDLVKAQFKDYFSEQTVDDDDTQTVFQDRVRLTLETSFTGKDKLITRLAAGNAEALLDSSAGGMGLQTFNLGNTGGNDVIVDWLAYYRPLGEKGNLYIAATGGIHSDYVNSTYNPYFEDFDGGNGALSTFASESPIYRIGGGAGAALSFNFSDSIGASLGYLADNAADPTEGNGLFNGEYAALAQLDFNLGDRLGLGLTYVNSYHTGGNAIFDAGGGTPVVGTLFGNYVDTTVEANSYGAQVAFQISDKISLSGFGMYTDANDVEIYSYGGGLAFADLGKEGNVLGIFAGAPPYSDGESGGLLSDNKTPLHIEGFYKYQINDNISITPGVIWLNNSAEGAFGEDSAWIGTLRTTFTF